MWRLGGQRAYQVFYNRIQSTSDIGTIFHYAKKASDWNLYSPYPWDLSGKVAFQQRRFDLAQSAFSKAIEIGLTFFVPLVLKLV